MRLPLSVLVFDETQLRATCEVPPLAAMIHNALFVVQIMVDDGKPSGLVHGFATWKEYGESLKKLAAGHDLAFGFYEINLDSGEIETEWPIVKIWRKKNGEIGIHAPIENPEKDPLMRKLCMMAHTLDFSEIDDALPTDDLPFCG
jgi:hypothetical protein